MKMWLLSIRTMPNEVAKHKNNANDLAEHKNNENVAAKHNNDAK